MKIGLFFGSFNPVHTGHLIVAEQMLEASGLDKVWFVLSPQNPFKLQQNLLDQQLRFRLLQRERWKTTTVSKPAMWNFTSHASLLYHSYS